VSNVITSAASRLTRAKQPLSGAISNSDREIVSPWHSKREYFIMTERLLKNGNFVPNGVNKVPTSLKPSNCKHFKNQYRENQ